ncbi:MAG: adenylate/guanylate cyclase domain-containing protein [Alphaproteobacteria bacterium]|nr:adenylate/guanylate cyclase domain-containing protein [Alphaproteobacteria bacterium]MCW5739810.1 adenylate/guanylate cyclase domain-containing protein [Alphaproteobacteria bacterium]
MKRLRRFLAARLPLLASLAVLVGALLLRAADPAAVTRLRDFAFDTFQRIQPRAVPADMPVRIVDIDEEALAAHGQWPWPRTIVARLTERLVEKGALVIAFDVIFAEPDRSSIPRLARDLASFTDPETLNRIVTTFPDNDVVFAAALAGSRSVLGFGFEPVARGTPPRRKNGFAAAGDDPRGFLPIWPGSVKPLDILEQAAKGLGSVNTDPDPSSDAGVVRRVPMLFRLGGQSEPYPALAIETLRVAQDASTYIAKSSNASGQVAFGVRTGMVSIKVGQVEIPTDAQGRITLYDSGHRRSRYVSARAVLDGSVPADRIDGHIVFIGTSALGLKDLRNTPIAANVPGVEVHAQIVEQVLSGVYLLRPDFATGLELVFIVLVGAIFVVLVPRLGGGQMALGALLAIAIAVFGPWLVFWSSRLLLDPIYPAATLAAVYAVGSAFSFMRAEAERARIRGAFGMYLSPDLVSQLARNPDQLKLGGEQREITVMFTDVRGFTTIAEQFDPQGLAVFMNRFLTPMTDIILEAHGTVDKYMGDNIMAFWNAPLELKHHPRNACEAALVMTRRLAELNVEWRREAHEQGRNHIPVMMGIGINTGVASVGNFGSTQRFAYTLLGDSVNLASRLEGQCKTYAVGTILGEATAKAVGEFALVEIDLIQVKGKTEPERIYALAGDRAMAATPAFAALLEKQEAFLVAYRAGDFEEALARVRAAKVAAEAAGWVNGYHDVMRKRTKKLIAAPPPIWDGVFVAKDK